MSYQTGFIVEPVRSATREALREEVEQFIGLFADDKYMLMLFEGLKNRLAAWDIRSIELDAISFTYADVLMAERPGAMALAKRIQALACRIGADEKRERLIEEGLVRRVALVVKHREAKLPEVANSSHQLDLVMG